jgi:large subunit ribosomal protein L21
MVVDFQIFFGHYSGLGFRGSPSWSAATAKVSNFISELKLMYAVIKTGGKQYRVAVGEKLKIEQIPAEVGSQITLDQVMLVGSGDAVTVGTPLVKGASVAATVLAQARHDKVRIFKLRRRKHYKKSQGHRQHFTEILISGITAA